MIKMKKILILSFAMAVLHVYGFGQKDLLLKTALIAHRGESSLAPENTLAAFQLAWKSGADAVELDIHLTADNRIVAIHDANTKRTAGMDYIVKNTPSEVLRKLDVGSFKDSSFCNERIPFLEEVLQTIPPGKKLVIELKSGSDVLPWLDKIVNGSGKKVQLVFIAFDWQTIVAARQLFPENACYWLSNNKNEVLARMNEVSERGLTGLDLHFSLIDANMVKKAADLQLKIIAWTVDDPAIAKRLVEMGIEGITTNRTAWLRAKLGEM
jgi:glycerophosphoryl diester phosphodiesterase